jgi:hypothetical protein
MPARLALQGFVNHSRQNGAYRASDRREAAAALGEMPWRCFAPSRVESTCRFLRVAIGLKPGAEFTMTRGRRKSPCAKHRFPNRADHGMIVAQAKKRESRPWPEGWKEKWRW